MVNLSIQLIDINSDDLPTGENYWDKQFVITFYGKTEDEKNVICNVYGYKPYFYLRVPGNWGNTTTKSFMKRVISTFIQSWYSSSKTCWKGSYVEESLELQSSYNFYGYNYDQECDKTKQYRFAKLSFESYGDMKKCISAIQTFYKVNVSYLDQDKFAMGKDKNGKPLLKTWDKKIKNFFHQTHNCDCVANLYESKIHPMLRFIHEKQIETCGWINIEANDSFITSKDQQMFNVDIEIDNLPTRCISALKTSNNISCKFITASFDIECDSSHGDFPNPNKDFKKPAIDIHESYFRNSLIHVSYEFKKKNIIKWIKQCFEGGSDDIQSIYTENGIYSEKSIQLLEDKLDETFFEMFDNSKSSSKEREKAINTLTRYLNEIKNENDENIIIRGDPIIQIGTVFHKYGDKECYDRSIVVIGNQDKPDEKICDDIPNVNVYPCNSEKELLLKWKDLILHHNPDLFTGYNIFGFDFDYINKRVDYLFPCNSKCGRYHDYKCPKNDFYRLGRLMRNRESDKIEELSIKSLSKPKTSMKYYSNFWEKRCQVVKKELSSSGLGDNILNYISMDGRVIFDIQKEIQKGYALDSYKLDNVSAHFMKGRIDKRIILRNKDQSIQFYVFETSTLGNLKINDYITINLYTKYGTLKYNNNQKFKIVNIGYKKKWIAIKEKISLGKYKKDLVSFEWCLAKDDVSPQQIFEFHKSGGAEGRAKIAKYCIMDCELCIHLLQLLDIVPNNMGMANVSNVPLSYIFLRGQGIKISSLVTKVCSEQNTRIPTLKNYDADKIDSGFEGAIVLEPTPGIYLDDPVSVLDYASLYPSSIIEKNLSHETFMCTQEDIDNNPGKYDWIKNIPHHIISYDDYSYQMKGKTVHKIKEDTQTTCYFAKYDENKNKRGIIPTILQTLLDERRNTRKRIKLTDDEDKKKVLDGLQLAYKVCANSVYGQMGAKTSPICFKIIAACTTAIGRERIDDASIGVKRWAEAEGYEIPEIVYGDTDSVFVKFSRKEKDTGRILEGKEALQYCIDCGVKAGEWVTDNMLHKPQDLEYEKTFFPFILISKKRYTGDKYELSAEKLKERTSMGIVMKRRDNAAIVKYVFGNVIEIIINQKSVDKAIQWLIKTLKEIVDGKIDKSMFIITKSLSGYYKNPEGIAHKVLADRMAERNPGNKPKPNDRIPFMYRVLPKETLYDYNNLYKSGARKGQPREKKVLQGDRIEHPDFMEENNIQIDYKFYISNQIMNPVKQVLDLEKTEEETKEIFKNYI